MDIKNRLEYLREEIRYQRISTEELAELQSLAKHIEPGDIELLEAAGVPEFNNEEDEVDDRITALAEHLQIPESDISEMEYSAHEYETPEGDYQVLTDEEADDAWDESLENYIDDCILPELPEHLQNYFDTEKWKRDAKHDGRGHSLSGYDGEENEIKINDTYYYIYRTN